MIGQQVLNNIYNSVMATGFVDRIYHSVEIVTDYDTKAKANMRFPAFRIGDGSEYEAIGPDDSKGMFVYFRPFDSIVPKGTQLIGGSEQAYNMAISHRMVIYSEYEMRNFNDLMARFINALFFREVTIKKIILSADELLRSEAEIKNFTFGPDIFYKAIDFDIMVTLTKNNCVQEISCGTLENPICKPTN